MAAGPRILYLGDNKADYLSDGVLHGLRSLLGERVIDYPKRDILYRSYPDERRARLYGRGFTLYGLLDEVDVDRARVPERLAHGEFDLVVIGDIWRDFGYYVALFPHLPRERTAILDGTDSPLLFPWRPAWRRVPQWWLLPRAHTRFPYFKREWSAWSLLGRSRGDLRTIAFSFPAEKIVPEPTPKRSEFASHVVDPEAARALGRETRYAFDREEDYYADLRAARFGITTKRDGWDCLRHYEIAAAGAVPCFRDLQRKPWRNAPHGLVDGVNCLAYSSFAALRRRIAALGDDDYARLQAGALAWVRANSTRARAAGLLAAMGHGGVAAVASGAARELAPG